MFLVRGHRGVGKSSFLRRVQNYFPEIKTIDLDQYVEEKESLRIDQIFEARGEAYFRDLEQKYLSEIYQAYDPKLKNPLVVSLGGGYQGDLPKDVMQIMLTRSTDKEGRIFFDRPRILNMDSELEESKKLYASRDESYKSKSHFVLELEEGFDFSNSEERSLLEAIFYPERERSNAQSELYFCLSGSCVDKILHSDLQQEFYRRFPVDRLELRSDIISSLSHIRKLIEIFGEEKIILSLRSFDSQQIFQDLKEEFPNILLDWDISFGMDALRLEPDVFSSHPGVFGSDTLGKFVEFQSEFPEANLKLACEFANTGDLMSALDWQKQDLKRRSLFPISSKGAWQWLRLYLQNKQNFQFVSNPFFKEVSDQPSIYQAYLVDRKKTSSAVIGYPIGHSFSPSIHFEQKYFAKELMLKIPIEEENFEEMLYLLQSLGLSYLAVTSPLKEKAKSFASHSTELADELKAANTLSLGDDGSYCENTDYPGFLRALESIGVLRDTNVILWGGGGTLNMLKKAFVNHLSYSARTGELRVGEDKKEGLLGKALVWAISNEDIAKGCKLPPLFKDLEFVIDLSYKESSLAKEYAKKHSLKYISGLCFLEKQGELQREFWNKHGLK